MWERSKDEASKQKVEFQNKISHTLKPIAGSSGGLGPAEGYSPWLGLFLYFEQVVTFVTFYVLGETQRPCVMARDFVAITREYPNRTLSELPAFA